MTFTDSKTQQLDTRNINCVSNTTTNNTRSTKSLSSFDNDISVFYTDMDYLDTNYPQLTFSKFNFSTLVKAPSASFQPPTAKRQPSRKATAV